MKARSTLLAIVVPSALFSTALGSPPPGAGFLIASSPRAHAQFVYSPISFPSDHTPHLFNSPSAGKDRGTSSLQFSAERKAFATTSPVSLSPGARVVGNEDTHIAYEPEDKWSIVRGAPFLSGSSHRTSSLSPPTSGRRVSRPAGPGPKLHSVAPTTLTYTFTGHGVDWYGSKSPFHGQALVLLDGREVARVDAYSPRWLDQQLLFSSSRDLRANITGTGDTGLGTGRHELQIVVRGESQRRSKGTTVDLDMLVVWSGEGRKKRGATGGLVSTGPEAKGRRSSR